jgi:hypothetical protein
MKTVVVVVLGAVAFTALLACAGAHEAFSSPDRVRDSLSRRWLDYSMHALQRMKQRGITQQQVQRTVASGTVNPQKSDPQRKYAIEMVDNGRDIRVVIAPYLWLFATVVTVIDLGPPGL